MAAAATLYQAGLFLGTKPHPLLMAAGAVVVVAALGVGVYSSIQNADEKADDINDKGCQNSNSTDDCSSDSKNNDGKANEPVNPPNIEDFDDPDNLPEGWEWRGRGEPGSREGAYHNPDTGESLHDDRTHPPPKRPHHTYTDPKGQRWDNFGDGYKKQQ